MNRQNLEGKTHIEDNQSSFYTNTVSSKLSFLFHVKIIKDLMLKMK